MREGLTINALPGSMFPKRTPASGTINVAPRTGRGQQDVAPVSDSEVP